MGRKIIRNDFIADVPNNYENYAMCQCGYVLPGSLPGQSLFGCGCYCFMCCSGTFTVPDGVTSLRVRVLGAGGSGGTCCWRNGGGGGGFAMGLVGVTPGAICTVTVGVGSNVAWSTGGTSSFGSEMSATGGQGSCACFVGGTGVGGTIINSTGGDGGSFWNNPCGGSGGGGGAGSQLGNGGAGGYGGAINCSAGGGSVNCSCGAASVWCCCGVANGGSAGSHGNGISGINYQHSGGTCYYKASQHGRGAFACRGSCWGYQFSKHTSECECGCYGTHAGFGTDYAESYPPNGAVVRFPGDAFWSYGGVNSKFAAGSAGDGAAPGGAGRGAYCLNGTGSTGGCGAGSGGNGTGCQCCSAWRTSCYGGCGGNGYVVIEW